MRKKQIGIIGSMADLGLSDSGSVMAKELGRLMANNNSVLVYGFEGDMGSFSEIAASSCIENGGETMAFLWGDPKESKTPSGGMVVKTGQMRGGGREFPMILSCDGLVSIGGGSGTLMELAMAYQFNIPVVVMGSTGGWSEKLANTFLDDRKRYKFESVDNPFEAIKKLIDIIDAKK